MNWTLNKLMRLMVGAIVVPALLFAADDRGYLLENGSEALGKRVAMIREAKEEILISTYILRNNASSRFLVKELIAAERRGVKVRLLLDQAGILDSGTKRLLSYMITQGIEVKVYNPITIWNFWRVFKLNERMHGKLFVVDGTHYMTGGRNLWDQSFGLGKKPHDDLEIYVKGSTAVTAKTYFDELWYAKDKAVPWKKTALFSPNLKTAHQRLLKTKGFEPQPFDAGLKVDRSIDLAGVEFIGDKISATTHHRDRLYPLLESAVHTVRIETPWIVPTALFKESIEKIIAKGVDTGILTNSPSSAENPFRALLSRIHSWALAQLLPPRLFERGSGGRSLHSKYWLIDNVRGYFGAFNIGLRSEGPNLEVGVIIESTELVREANAIFEKRALGSVPMPTHRWLSTPCMTFFSHLTKGFF